MRRIFISLFISFVFVHAFAAEMVQDGMPESPEMIREKLRKYFLDAARQGNQEILSDFIAARYDLNVRDERGYTGLILAAYNGHRQAVEQLLAAGADPCAQDKRGNTALMGAIFKGELTIARRLMATRCNLDQRNHAGQTAAMHAALFQRIQLLDSLEERGADLHASDASGNTPESLRQGNLR
ncbi:ankyrin repeat domain-containing protein [Burkholderia lata]|uniref:ankyrin repeat domain-containing protein n=1 Tax=Burkholderia lata (strain ATCC 17760 / DSM 23089 / LMG 22485 / NCIMB 9086 / R18194 / 383) TaxID=482957 RepID=UPI0015837E1E|nr:ankyrin repeat domain-containing protein [Burkholderia lata]